jgi:enoyl-CoA hydratase/carnithine racemase
LSDRSPVRVEDYTDGYRTILLNRPQTRNAIDTAMVAALTEGIVTAPGWVVVLGSTSPTAFSSGADVKLGDTERAAVSESLYALYQEMRATPKIIIAAASGHAVGGGAQLLISSDLRFGSPDLTVRFMGPGHGLAVGAWGLPSLVGRGRAMDLCLSMRSVSADEALAIGLIDRLVEDPIGDAKTYAEMVCALDKAAVAAIKRIVLTTAVNDALAVERSHNASWSGSIPARDRP